MTGKALMVVGTMSSAGKSLLVTGLCRIFARRGFRVAPYKSQNMSNNAGVCTDGSEIGRAQYTQALACGIEPTAEMNPILLKPEADSRSQVIVMGKPYAHLTARNYYQQKTELWKIATKALDNLREEYDLVIIEGAGSPVELNLKRGDIVNMAIAKYAKAPVLLAGDIDGGGIFPQLLGTLWLLEADEKELVKGLIVNKFRGDITLFYDGVSILEEKGGVPVIGVVPYIRHQIPEEDAVAIEPQNFVSSIDGDIDIVVIRLPRISNFDDFDPLNHESNVRVIYADSPNEVGNPYAIILPGTKSTIADLSFLQESGLFEYIQEYAKNGGRVVGICGGYQMLGELISDPEAVESTGYEIDGLGLLSIETIFQPEKATYQIKAKINLDTGWFAEIEDTSITGYEIHMGVTKLHGLEPWLSINLRSGKSVSVMDGAISDNMKVWGCYIHGIFENHAFRRAWLKSLGWQPQVEEIENPFYASLDDLADVLEEALDMEFLDKVLLL
ncbi:cobyric acid synthase [Chloroflexota bacterium]